MFGRYTAASTVDQHTNALGGNGEGGVGDLEVYNVCRAGEGGLYPPGLDYTFPTTAQQHQGGLSQLHKHALAIGGC